ncbi:hypothetical protein PENSTE_c002G07230 [Penicillium steckii]|uniref:Uncharacterized protein n=1 Tax=Penicillium steckii TaxID=303698 RepID=A0A1V6TVA7_9EURO|nr:hypothetical protein PENSTE_c002G07230 [Penicillium steckii]
MRALARRVCLRGQKAILDIFTSQPCSEEIERLTPRWVSSVISENAPDAIKTGEIKNHFGRKVAIVWPHDSLFMGEKTR